MRLAGFEQKMHASRYCPFMLAPSPTLAPLVRLGREGRPAAAVAAAAPPLLPGRTMRCTDERAK